MAALPTDSAVISDLMAHLTRNSELGYFAAAWTVSRWLTRPTRARPARTPSDLGLMWDPLECRTADVQRLAGWVVTPPGARATVALFHGVRQTRVQTLDLTALLAAAGYRCVAFDHRAHGESSGNRTSFGYYEGRDVVAVLELIARRWPAQPRAALGLAMGGAAICYATAEMPSMDAVVLAGVASDIATAFRSRMTAAAPGWVRQFSEGVMWATERRLGIRLEQLVPAAHVAALAPTPVLMVPEIDSGEVLEFLDRHLFRGTN